MKVRYLFLISLICAVNLIADTKILVLDSLSVTDSINTSSTSTFLNRESLSKLSSSRTVESILLDLPGIDIVRRGSSIQSRGVYLRGFDESRMVVVLNDRVLTGAGSFGGDIIDWNSIPLDQIESIEIIRGGKTAEYGSSLAGVIKISTVGSEGISQNRVRLAYGVTPQWSSKSILDQSFDGSFSHQNNIGKVADYSINLSRWNSDGFLRNNDVKRSTIGGNLTIHFPADIDLRGSIVRSSTDFGFNIENNPRSTNFDPSYPESDAVSSNGTQLVWKRTGGKFYGDRSNWINIRNQYDLALSKKIQNGTISANGFLNDQSRTEYFYAINDTNKLVIERFSKPEDFTRGLKISANQLFNTHNVVYGTDVLSLRSLTYDVRHIDTSYFTIQPENTPHSTTLATYLGFYLQDNVSMFDTTLDIQAGIRFDRFQGHGDSISGNTKFREGLIVNKISPNLGVAVHAWKNGTVSINGAYLTRMPSSSEYHFYYVGFQELADHTQLIPENARQIEGSVSQKLRDNRINLEARAYYYSIKEYIRSLMGAKPDHIVYNVDKVDFMGIELEGKYSFPKYVVMNANYAYQTTRKEGDQLDAYVIQPAMLSELPEHKLHASAKFSGSKGATAQVKFRYVSDKEVVDGILSVPTKEPVKGKPVSYAPFEKATLATVNGFSTVDLSGSYPLVRNSAISMDILGGIDNLFDVRYEEKFGFPMPGTTLTVGIEAKF